MMKGKVIKSVVAISLASLFSIDASAVTIDYRHEMKDTAKRGHRDRLLISHRFASGFGISSEVKWKSGDNKPDTPYSDTVSNGTEVVASYLYKFDKALSLESGLSLDSSSSANNYRPYIRGGVVFNDIVSTTLRYRPYYKRVASGSGEDDHGHQVNLVVGLKLTDKFTLSNDFEWKRSENTVLWDNDKESWLYEGKLTYKYDKNWRPYMSIANVSGDSKVTDERQTRYRVGVQYVF